MKDPSDLSRRTFLQVLGAAPLVAGFIDVETSSSAGKAYFTVVNHWHQAGVGWFFPSGTVNGRDYRRAYSIFYAIQKTIDGLDQFPWLDICLEFDSHAYEMMYEEDPDFVREKFRPLVASGRIDPVGGTYSQPYAQLVGWQSNVRQLVEGRAVVREVLGKEVECFLVEEIIFHPQMPQLLRRSGYTSASLQSHNNGSMPVIRSAVINWRGADGSEIPTIPNNSWMISLTKQYQSWANEVDQAAVAQQAMFTIWAETWPPGMDWGASYLPYTIGFQSLRAKGLESVGLTKYMRRRCEPGAKLDSRYLKLDEARFDFGWPQNKGILWETLGGWGFEGDCLLKENRRIEHELNAAEILAALAPDSHRAKQLRDFWKKLMVTQNHDCFIVSGFSAEYEDVHTTNLEVARMRFREIDSGVRQLRQETLARLAASSGSDVQVICQNPSGISVRQPIVLETDVASGFDYSLASDGQEISLQRLEPQYANERPKLVGVVGLPAFGFKTGIVRKIASATVPSPQPSEEIANEFYSVNWDESRKGFRVLAKASGRAVFFRPFTGDITHVKESWWASPNSGVKFRAKTFDEVAYARHPEAGGPVYHALAVRGNLVTLSTTQQPAAWVTARAALYQGLNRVDLSTEFESYPQLGLQALAEFQLEGEHIRAFRDYPFGEEESLKEQLSALNYVRLESPGFALLVAHGGTQQFFLNRQANHAVLRNMIARGTFKSRHRWNWSITTGPSFTPASSYRFAEAVLGPVVEISQAPLALPASLITVNDPAVVVFRYGVDSGKTTVWLMNYSAQEKQAELTFAMPIGNCRKTDLEGKPVGETSATADSSGKSVKLNLGPWEIVALCLEPA